MKTIQIILLLFISSFTFGQKQFEGVITMKASGTQTVTSSSSVNGQEVESDATRQPFKTDMTMYLKDDVTVVDIPSSNGMMRAMMNYVTGEVTMINSINGQRTINRINISNVQGHQTNENPRSAEFEATGNTKMISGYKCLEYKVKDEEGSGTMWVAPDLKHININERMLLLKMKRNNNMGFLQYYDGVEGFVMEMRGKDNEGDEFKLDVTVKEKTMNAELFKMPEVSKEQQKEITKRDKMMQLSREYRQKMMDVRNDPEKIKVLSEELKKKMEELQQQ